MNKQKKQQDEKPRVFSGVQPTGILHIGNYIGALKVWVENQDLYDNIFCIVDLHAITIPEAINPKDLKQQVREVAAMYLACGIDPKKSTIFVQSEVPSHSELAWILNCVTPISWLEKMTQYKSKSGKQKTVNAGLLNYPVLMAADILLYETDIVPVGEDQKQHVELSRDIARRFNSLFGTTLKIPKSMIRKSGARIMGLDNPLQKMSKSAAIKKNDHAIMLTDSPEIIRKKISKAVTDANGEISFRKASPGVKNLLTIHETFSGKPTLEIEEYFKGKGYGFLKKEVAEVVINEIRPIQEKYFQILNDKPYLEKVLEQGKSRALGLSNIVLRNVKNQIGLS